MDTFVAAVFDDEAHAFKAGDAMRELHQNGDLIVYSAAIIGKDSEGNISLRKAADEGPIGTVFGMMVGALIGVLAGPAAVASGAAVAGSAAAASYATGGMLAGGVAGSYFGMFRDLMNMGIDSSVLDQVSTELSPGKTALVAAIDEVWITPLNTSMHALGGKVFRKLRVDIIDEQIERDAEQLNSELELLKTELAEAGADARQTVEASIDSTRAKITEIRERAEQRLEALDKEMEARLAALDEQIKTAVGAAKAKFQKRKAELGEEYAQRSEKLKKAARLAGEALS